MKDLKVNVLSYLDARHADLYSFWTKGGKLPEASVEAHCDMVYAFFLLDEMSSVSSSAIEQLIELSSALELPGWRLRRSLERISVHNCAYLFGALNLLKKNSDDIYDEILSGRDFDADSIFDPDSGLPKYSRKWAHHNWRLSHWLGGVPSLILSLEKSGSRYVEGLDGEAWRIRDALSKLIDPNTGLIRAYKSEFLQALFRAAYRMRHDPELGDVGGIAHILWVDHALGRKYTAVDSIFNKASDLFCMNSPFMEKVPYCLDFDVVQIVRTAGEQVGTLGERNKNRAAQMMKDISEYFESPGDGYSLHKVPGALATYHECAFISGEPVSFVGDKKPVDIILNANWL